MTGFAQLPTAISWSRGIRSTIRVWHRGRVVSWALPSWSLLSLGTDLGLGQPMEHMVRSCLVALRLAEQRGLDESQRTAVYYSGLFTGAYGIAWFLGSVAIGALFNVSLGAVVAFCVTAELAAIPIIMMVRRATRVTAPSPEHQ